LTSPHIERRIASGNVTLQKVRDTGACSRVTIQAPNLSIWIESTTGLIEFTSHYLNKSTCSVVTEFLAISGVAGLIEMCKAFKELEVTAHM
jgi:hypothetical protein